MAESLPTWGAWDADVQDDPYPRFAAMREACPVHRVRLGDGHDAWLVIGHAAARQALKDGRLSKDMLAAMDADPTVVDEGLPGPAFARHMLAVDPPDHTRLRGLVARAFAPSRIAALEPSIERIAHELLDELERSGPGGRSRGWVRAAVPVPGDRGAPGRARDRTSRRCTRRSGPCSSRGAARRRRMRSRRPTRSSATSRSSWTPIGRPRPTTSSVSW